MIESDAYILIGGRSTRLGRDKATADLGGQTLAQRAFQTVTDALPTSRVTFVAAYEAQYAIQAVVAGGRFIFDQIPARGPLGGFHAALADALSPWIFIFATDYPFVSPELICLLGASIAEGFGAIVPEQPDGRLQPLCAFFKTETAKPLVDEMIGRPRVPPPLHELVRQLDPQVIPPTAYEAIPGAHRFFINVNSESDLELASEIERKLSNENQIK